MRAERWAGEMLVQMKQRGELASPGNGEKFGANKHSSHVPSSIPKRLADIGLTKDQSQRWQALAAMPEEHVDTAVATANDTAGQVTTAFMLRQVAYTFGVPTYTPEQTAVTARELTALLVISAVERQVIEAALMSVMTAIERVAPASRTELQKLVADYIANPDDRDTTQGLGALPRNARAPHH